MKIAILGFGLQGKSAFEYLSRDEQNEITICDKSRDIEIPEKTTPKLGEDYLKGLGKFELIVRSPSIHPREIVKANNEQILEKVTTNTNEFFKSCPSKNIIGVTGTKGKGTTSSLIAKMLEADGKTVHLGGNIGTPPLELLNSGTKEDDWVVLELANFQLIDIKYSPKIAACLMVVPEHMDWHEDFSEYITAKQQLFRHQSEDGSAIYFAGNTNSEHITSVSRAPKTPYMKHPGADVIENKVVIDGQNICDVSEIKLLGKHNWQNICAAATAFWQVSQNVDAVRSVITTFGGLEMRLEFIRELSGVKYYNDSFGTTPETAQVAIEAFSEPKVVILGGSDKGASFNDLAETVLSNNTKAVIVIGETGSDISSTLSAKGFKNIIQGADNMPEIVNQAKEAAGPGDIVLLSTGCASFGMFKNYKDRGKQFNQAVQGLS